MSLPEPAPGSPTLRPMTGPALTVFAVGSPYAWDVVESASRLGRPVCCVDNLGGADDDLPGLVDLTDATPRGSFTLGLASADHRRAAAHAAHAAGYDDPVALTDPTAVVASTSALGHGAYVNAGTVIGSKTTIGCHVNLNRSVSIGHHCELGFAAATGPGVVLAGSVRVAAGAFIGAGATVLPEVTIGRKAIVGAGAVVRHDVEDHGVVVGSPARLIKRRDLAGTELDREELNQCPHC